MSQNSNNNDLLFCSHTKEQKEKTFHKTKYLYCENCGNIAIKHNNNFYYTIKPKLKQKPVEINPILITQLMKLNQETSYPNLYNIYNLDVKDNVSNIREKLSIYFAKRKLILLYLQNMTRQLKYTDLSFYHCLLLVDLYLSRNITEEMTEEELLYILIGFFLVSCKLKETDIFEPELIGFNNIDPNIILSFEKIKLYEVQCLKFINYKYFIYSTYDWVNIFISNGFIFENEIDYKDYISEIHTYTYRLLIAITPKNIFIKYSTFHMALSLIQIAREDKIDENKRNDELFEKILDLYDISKKDYKDCYREIKAVINKEKNNSNKLNKSKFNASRNEILILRKIENNKIENKSSEKINKKVDELNLLSKSNLKKRFKEARTKNTITNLTSSGKAKKNFRSIIVQSMNNNKNHNFNNYKKNLEIIEYINSNLPNIYKNGTESNIVKTEEETICGMNYQIGKQKNDTLNNLSISDIKLKKKICSSVEHENLKKIDLFKNKRKITPLKIGKYMGNETKGFLVENEKYSKFLCKNNTNIFHNENNSVIFNKNGEYLKFYNNISKNDININDKETKIIIDNYYNHKNNNNFNLYKNNTNIFKNNLKPLYRGSTSDYIGYNNKTNVKIELPLNLKNIKIGEDKGNSPKKDNMEKISSSIEKEMKILTSRNTNYKTNTKSFLINIKYGKSNFNNHKDLFLKKSSYNDNSKLPKLK